MATQEEQSIATVKKFYEYFEKGDREGWISMLADDCELHEAPSLPYGGAYIGKQAFLRGHKNIHASWENLEYQILDYFASGESVVMHLNIGATGRKTGKHFWLPIMELWRVRSGLIKELRPFIFDTARMVEVYGV